MNNHYTGYELELNQSRQANIRSEFEHQALTKSLNEDRPAEGLSRTRKQSRGLSRIKKAFFISLVGAVLVLAYFILASSNQAAALLNKGVATGSNQAQSGAFYPHQSSSLAAINPSLVGNYTVRVVAKDIPPLLRFEEPSVNKYRGNWFVSLDEQGTYTASLNDQLVVQGRFEVASDQLTFTSEEGAPLCGNDPEEMTGTYSWYPAEQGLQISFISDKCYARSLVLSSHFLKQLIPVPVPPRGE
jgi:hypothetical protein